MDSLVIPVSTVVEVDAEVAVEDVAEREDVVCNVECVVVPESVEAEGIVVWEKFDVILL